MAYETLLLAREEPAASSGASRASHFRLLTADAAEGSQAFFAKREPDVTGT